MPSDQTLLCQIQNKDSDAFELLYELYAAALQRHMRSIVHEEEASADLVQELFVRVWQRAEQWSAPGSVKAWLYKIATNLALNHLRSRRRRPQQPLDPPVEYQAEEGWHQESETRVPARLMDSAALQPESVVANVEQKRQLWQMVDELSPDKSQLLHMVYESEMDLRSIADALDIPEGTVKSRIYHGKRQLAKRWQEGGFDY